MSPWPTDLNVLLYSCSLRAVTHQNIWWCYAKRQQIICSPCLQKATLVCGATIDHIFDTEIARRHSQYCCIFSWHPGLEIGACTHTTAVNHVWWSAKTEHGRFLSPTITCLHSRGGNTIRQMGLWPETVKVSVKVYEKSTSWYKVDYSISGILKG